MIFLDANFLVSYYIYSEEQHERAKNIMNTIENDNRVISRLIIAETINILFTKLKVDKNLIKETYDKLNNEYILIEDHCYYDKTLDNIMNSSKRFPFFDYVFITLMKELGIKEIATFDKHFNNIDGIERIY